MVTACAVAIPGGYGDGGNDIRRKQPQHQEHSWSDHHGSSGQRYGQGSSDHGSFNGGETGHDFGHHDNHGERQKVTHDVILGGQHGNGFRPSGGPQFGHGSSGFAGKNYDSNYGGSRHGDGGYHGGSSHGSDHGSHYDHQHTHDHDHGHGHGWSDDNKKYGNNRGEKS